MDDSDEARFRGLYESYASAILAYFRRRTDSETAKDCTADTFLVAWRRLDDVPEQPLPWLYGVARRVLSNHRRSTGRMARLVDRLRRQPSEAAADPELVVIRRFEDSDLAEAMMRLRPEDRELLFLSTWEELPHGDIGTVLGCSSHAVDQRVYRAMHRLARELGRGGHRQGGTTISAMRSEGDVP